MIKTEENDDEIVTTSEGSENVLSVMQLETLIHGYLSDIEKLKEKLTTQREMYESSFEQDAQYSQQEEEEKKVKRAKKTIKDTLSKSPSVSMVLDRVNELKSELRDANEELIGALKEYQRLANSSQLTTPTGEIYEIVNTLKLKKRSA